MKTSFAHCLLFPFTKYYKIFLLYFFFFQSLFFHSNSLFISFYPISFFPLPISFSLTRSLLFLLPLPLSQEPKGSSSIYILTIKQKGDEQLKLIPIYTSLFTSYVMSFPSRSSYVYRQSSALLKTISGYEETRKKCGGNT